MDMKRILQAMDGVATKPVVGANDMAKFLSIVDKNASMQILNEGKNPHKVSLPVQMAMQHYQNTEPTPAVVRKPSLLNKFFNEVEQELAEERTERQQLIRQYSQTIAERVLMKENHSIGFKPGPGAPGMQSNIPDSGHLSLGETPIEMDPEDPMNPTVYGHQGANPAKLKTRMLRAAGQLKDLAERAQTDSALGWESIARNFDELAMNIEQIRHGIAELAATRKKGGVKSRGIDKHIGEAVMPTIKPTKTKVKAKAKTSTCRTGQTQTGMQTKDGKLVPKCSVTGIKK